MAQVAALKVEKQKREVGISETPTAASRTFQEIPLLQIQANPLNPRKIFVGKKFDDLIESVRVKGVLEPILVRPIKMQGSSIFEIIAGERRFRASREVAESNGGIEKARIPAIVQAMSDEDAFDAMTIENLQRADLTELEEARSFQAYLEHKGPGALTDLAERISIDSRYIRRRVVVLSLPEEVLGCWEKGELSFGHLEQLARVNDDESLRQQYVERIFRCNYSVASLKASIDSNSPMLKHTSLFDKEEKRCKRCHENSKVQRDLFGDGMAGDKTARCLNPPCFKRRLNDWLQGHWSEFRDKHELTTNGFRFQGSLDYSDYEMVWKTIEEKCRDCRSFVSILLDMGEVHYKNVCLDKQCYRATYEKKTAGQGGNGSESKASRHGEYFREEFYKTRIPEALSTPDLSTFARQQLLLLSLLISNSEAKQSFVERHMADAEKSYGYYVEQDKLATKIFNLEEGNPIDEADLMEWFDEATQDIIMQTTTTANVRHAVASRIGINLATEWRIHEEYLKKKTKSEIIEFGEKSGILNDEKALSYLSETLREKSGRFDFCKKKDLMSVFLESGVDLAGKVPDEILTA